MGGREWIVGEERNVVNEEGNRSDGSWLGCFL